MGSTDETTGKVKQAAGDLTGDKELKHEGKIEELEGKAKNMADEAADKLKGELHRHEK